MRETERDVPVDRPVEVAGEDGIAVRAMADADYERVGGYERLRLVGPQLADAEIAVCAPEDDLMGARCGPGHGGHLIQI